MSTNNNQWLRQVSEWLESQWDKHVRNLVRNLLIWLFFSVMVTVLPLIFGSVVSYVKGDSFTNYYQEFSKRGELLLISTAIGASAVGEVYLIKPADSILKLIVFLACLFMVIWSVFIYAVVSNLDPHVASENVTNIEGISTFTFWITFGVSLTGVVIAEVKKWNLKD